MRIGAGTGARDPFHPTTVRGEDAPTSRLVGADVAFTLWWFRYHEDNLHHGVVFSGDGRGLMCERTSWNTGRRKMAFRPSELACESSDRRK